MERLEIMAIYKEIQNRDMVLKAEIHPTEGNSKETINTAQIIQEVHDEYGELAALCICFAPDKDDFGLDIISKNNITIYNDL